MVARNLKTHFQPECICVMQRIKELKNTQVNQQLSTIYRKLTRHGDAYLSYTEDKSVLFADGVSLLGKRLICASFEKIKNR